MNLEQEVSAGRRVIHTDAYPMSIGEIINIYRDREMDLHPEFQREFRWKPYQKSKLIESILLGIPLPSIFVAQRKDGIWDVVDGLQRLSTIMSFVRELRDENNELVPELVLEKTQYLPSLRGVSWNGENSTTPLPDELKRAFKREKIDVKIIKSESDENAKFELFQRLNTGGSDLSEQEVRNCLLLMLNKPAYHWLKSMSENDDFLACIDITDRQRDEKYQMEMILRFLISTKFDDTRSLEDSDMGPYITSQMKSILVDTAFDFETEAEHFRKTFKVLNLTLGNDSFKRYSHAKNKHEGAFSVALFECISSGVAFALLEGMSEESASAKLSEVSQMLPYDPEYKEATKHGMRGINRFPRLVQLARRLFR
jgi:hypothetical protein